MFCIRISVIYLVFWDLERLHHICSESISKNEARWWLIIVHIQFCSDWRTCRNVSRTHWWRRWRLCGGSLLWCWLPGLLPAPLQQGHWQAGGPPLLHWPVTLDKRFDSLHLSACNTIIYFMKQCPQWWGKFRMELNNSPGCPDWRRSTARSGPSAGRGWIGGLFAGIFFAELIVVISAYFEFMSNLSNSLKTKTRSETSSCECAFASRESSELYWHMRMLKCDMSDWLSDEPPKMLKLLFATKNLRRTIFRLWMRLSMRWASTRTLRDLVVQ